MKKKHLLKIVLVLAFVLLVLPVQVFAEEGIGNSCDNNAQCLTKYCKENVCSYCEFTSDCDSGYYCSNWSSKYCFPKKETGLCEHNVECKSGKCKDEMCFEEPKTPGCCKVTKKSGEEMFSFLPDTTPYAIESCSKVCDAYGSNCKEYKIFYNITEDKCGPGLGDEEEEEEEEESSGGCCEITQKKEGGKEDVAYLTTADEDMCMGNCKSDDMTCSYDASVDKLACGKKKSGERKAGALKELTMPSGIASLNQLSATSIPALVAGLIKTALKLVGSLALAMFVYGGLIIMTGGGLIGADKAAGFKKGMDIILWSAMGLFVILASYVIVNFIFQVL